MGVWERREEQSQRRKNDVCFGRWIQMELPSRQSVLSRNIGRCKKAYIVAWPAKGRSEFYLFCS